jgi:hypothetical protein
LTNIIRFVLRENGGRGRRGGRFILHHTNLQNEQGQLTGFEEQDRHLTQVEIDEMLRLVCDIGPKVTSNNAMPCWVIFLIKLFLDIRSDVLTMSEYELIIFINQDDESDPPSPHYISPKLEMHNPQHLVAYLLTYQHS